VDWWAQNHSSQFHSTPQATPPTNLFRLRRAQAGAYLKLERLALSPRKTYFSISPTQRPPLLATTTPLAAVLAPQRRKTTPVRRGDPNLVEMDAGKNLAQAPGAVDDNVKLQVAEDETVARGSSKKAASSSKCVANRNRKKGTKMVLQLDAEEEPEPEQTMDRSDVGGLQKKLPAAVKEKETASVSAVKAVQEKTTAMEAAAVEKKEKKKKKKKLKTKAEVPSVQESPLYVAMWERLMRREVGAEVEEEMEDASVVAPAPHEDSNFNVPQHAMEDEDVQQQQQVEDAPVDVVEADVGKEEDEGAIVKMRKFEGCRMLAEVENTESGGVGSRTRLQRRRRQSGTSDNTALGTISDPIIL
jgi:hypothetical protein